MAKRETATSVIIRPAKLADVAAITGIYNEAILTTTATFDVECKSVAERTQWLQSRGEKYPVLVAVVDGQIVGYAALNRWSERSAYDQTVESSFYVRSTHRGRGIGRTLKEEIIWEARRLSFHTIIARVAEGSNASLHLNQSAGFVYVGTLREVGRKFGKSIDVHIMQKILD
jgi:phosphinothricin acetyltransferase